MSESYQTELYPSGGNPLHFAAAFSISLVAGGLFSYIVMDLTASHYLLELMSLMFFEVPFIALFALLARKFGYGWCALMAAVSLTMSVALFEPHLSLIPVIYLKVIATGMVAGQFDQFGRSFFRRMTALAMPGFIIAVLFGGPMLYGGVTDDSVTAIREETLEVYQAFMTPDEAEIAVNNAMGFFESMFTVSVAFFMIFAVIEAWMSLQLAGWLLKRFGEIPPRIASFHSYKLPFHAIWFFLAGGLVLIADMQVLTPAALNLFAVMCGLYGIQGLAIVTTHASNLPLGRLPKVIFWVIFFLTIGFTGFLLIIAGVLDNWFNLRSFPVSPGGEKEGNTDENHFT